ncbi:hypothetical protein ACFT9M_19600 [Micromonospora purpureochromogenes]|uniref:hypothetical protein n=1 Tax=Micromonospora purpureochromogenes TaxID=47872 RepID=UPI00364398B4
MLPEYDLTLDLTNQARAEAAYPVRLTATGQPGYAGSWPARASISYGDPVQTSQRTDWVEVPWSATATAGRPGWTAPPPVGKSH